MFAKNVRIDIRMIKIVLRIVKLVVLRIGRMAISIVRMVTGLNRIVMRIWIMGYIKLSFHTYIYMIKLNFQSSKVSQN